MVVYICCAGGATSGLFCNKIKKEYEKLGKSVYVDDIYTISRAFKKEELEDYDVILAYGPAEKVTSSFIRDYNIDKFINLILVSPQVRYRVNDINKVLEGKNIPCAPIDMKVFGTMNGKLGLETIENLLNK
ncbi:PTS sugar transporter subunit IIB [Clostridium chrysemydis]|uniref:PTS sugar transporter subunit IIB n=1 Tax=Clostridium chrysemydis TaxID=2665504 RepID=UPI0018836C0E|nr:PTS beta-glucoside transporter subunit IIB [Clostridium chrysemydis]